MPRVWDTLVRDTVRALPNTWLELTIGAGGSAQDGLDAVS
jgi:hypothetical protein